MKVIGHAYKYAASKRKLGVAGVKEIPVDVPEEIEFMHKLSGDRTITTSKEINYPKSNSINVFLCILFFSNFKE